MPAQAFLHRRLVVGLTVLALVPGCAVEFPESNSALGASSGGGAAFVPAPPAARRAPVTSAPAVAARREQATAPPVVGTQAASGRAITFSASGDPMAVIMPPKHGTAVVSGSDDSGPVVRYAPAPGYFGNDQFSVSLGGGRQTVTVSITAGSQAR